MTRGLALALAVLVLAGCQSAARPSGLGSAAPASAGYRAKTPQGVDLVFEASRGLYGVPVAPGTYWLDQRYYRRSAARWESSPDLDGPWTACAPADLPAGLRYPGK
jgi:hypothetical protein